MAESMALRVDQKEEAVSVEVAESQWRSLGPGAQSCWAGPGILTCQLHSCNNCEEVENFYLVNATGRIYRVLPFTVESLINEGVMHAD